MRVEQHPTDEEIMTAVKAGRNGELALLYERHKSRFYNYFMKLTLDRELSQDLLQNLFVRILKYKHAFRVSQLFLPWCYRMARNMAYNELKKKSSSSKTVNVEQMAEELVDLSVDQEAQEREKQLMRALAKLPEDKRELIVWSKIEGLKYETIAQIRETTVGAIKVQVHRTMALLKNIYFEAYESKM